MLKPSYRHRSCDKRMKTATNCFACTIAIASLRSYRCSHAVSVTTFVRAHMQQQQQRHTTLQCEREQRALPVYVPNVPRTLAPFSLSSLQTNHRLSIPPSCVLPEWGGFIYLFGKHVFSRLGLGLGYVRPHDARPRSNSRVGPRLRRTACVAEPISLPPNQFHHRAIAIIVNSSSSSSRRSQ